jgi:hypothetical protein
MMRESRRVWVLWCGRLLCIVVPVGADLFACTARSFCFFAFLLSIYIFPSGGLSPHNTIA